MDCRPGDPTAAYFPFHLNALPNSCFLPTAGFSDDAGSFIGLSAFAGNYLGLDETITLGAQYGVRSRTLQLGLTKALVPDNHIQAGFAIYVQRFRYDESQEASLLAFSRDVTEPEYLDPDDRLKYVSHRYGAESFVNLALRQRFASMKLSYSFDVTGVRPLTAATSDYFSGLHFLSSSGANHLSGIRTSKIAASYFYNTIDHPLRPTHGVMFAASFGLAGLGGDVNLIEPAIEAKWFHRGLWSRHVLATRIRGSILSGFGGKAAPPFDRDYLGGEQEIRGFSSWAVSPIAYLPGAVSIPYLNSDGTVRTVPVLSGGIISSVPVTLTIPVYRPLTIGGDTKVVANVEYRIPLVGPFTLALFTDAGVDRAVFAHQLQFNAGVIDGLNAQFPAAEFTNRLLFQPGADPVRMSSGVELQAFVPKIRAPLRLYWAYNVVASTDILAPPIVADPEMYPNNATFRNAMLTYGAPQIFRDPRSMLRIAIGFAF
jgi:outer membrane protein insertion porin family